MLSIVVPCWLQKLISTSVQSGTTKISKENRNGGSNNACPSKFVFNE